MLKKLRIKFICIIMVIVTALVGIIMGCLIRFLYEDTQSSIEFALQNASMAPNFHRDNPGSVPHLPYFKIEKDTDGKLSVMGMAYFRYFEYEQLESVWNLVDGADEGELKEQRLAYQRFSSPRGEQYVFVDIASQRTLQISTVRNCVLISILALAAFFGISLLLAQWAVKPVEQMWEQQRRFVADASHELKTPLTIMMTNAELLQSDVPDEAGRSRCVSDILTVTREMRSLVDALLELARGDMNPVPANTGTVDLSQLTNDCVMLFEPIMYEKGLSLSYTVQEKLCVKGVEQYLLHLVEILLHNAMKYTPESNVVELSLRSQGNNCLLCVSNPSEPVSREELSKIFQRFYRADRTRSRDGSHGLGLAIARQIVTGLGGRIWAEYSQGKFYVYTLLPACENE